MKTVPLLPKNDRISSDFWLSPGKTVSFEEPEAGASTLIRRAKTAALGKQRRAAKVFRYRGEGEKVPRHATSLEVFEDYVAGVVGEAVKQQEAVDRLWFTIPAVLHRDTRLDYHQAIEQAVDRAGGTALRAEYITEPDAVIQYFRLVDGRLEQKEGQLECYLVVDSGAGTTNISVTFKPKTRTGVGKLAEGWTSSGVFQPVFSDALPVGGDWVNDKLVECFIQKARDGGASPRDVHEDVLRKLVQAQDIEGIKLKLSQRASCSIQLTGTGATESLQIKLKPKDLAAVVEEMMGLVTSAVHEAMAQAHARLANHHQYQSDLIESGVSSVEEFPRFLKYVIFAGGSAQLPGFRDALEQELNLAKQSGCRFIRTGDQYAYTVAAGLAAHAIEQYPPGEPSEQPPIILDRLIADVSLVYGRSQSDTVFPQRMFDANDFFSYPHLTEAQRPYPHGPHAVRIRLPVDRKKKQTMRFGLAHVAESELERIRPDDSKLLLLHNQEFWLDMDQTDPEKVPREILAVPSVCEQPHALVVDLFSFKRQGKGEPEHLGRLTHFLHAGSLTTETVPVEPGNPEATPTSLAFDLGTSKTICVRAEPPSVLEDFRGKRILVEAHEPQEEAEPKPKPKPKPEPEPEKKKAGKPKAAKRSDQDDPVKEQQESPAPQPPPPPVEDEPVLLKQIFRTLNGAGLQIDYADLVNLHLCLKVSPLTLLAGPPGVGKTSLARTYCTALGATESGPEQSLTRVAVQAHWTRPAQLLSTELGGSSQPSAFMELAQRSSEDKDGLYFAVLDELNLAQADYYLSDILSAMSDDGRICCSGLGDGKERDLELPIVAPDHRLFLLGTMNIDEAATPLTEKVLDRANLIEVCPRSVPDRIRRRIDLGQVEGSHRVSAETWRSYCPSWDVRDVPDDVVILAKLLRGEHDGEEELEETSHAVPPRAQVSMRALRDIVAYLELAELVYVTPAVEDAPEGDAHRAAESRIQFCYEDALDFQVQQRVLPRLWGGDEMAKPLERLERYCKDRQLERSLRRVQRMQHQLDIHGSFSFWSS